jgi:hypothetical protein
VRAVIEGSRDTFLVLEHCSLGGSQRAGYEKVRAVLIQARLRSGTLCGELLYSEQNG